MPPHWGNPRCGCISHFIFFLAHMTKSLEDRYADMHVYIDNLFDKLGTERAIRNLEDEFGRKEAETILYFHAAVTARMR